MKSILETNDAPRAIGPYSQAVRTGSFLFSAGQIALDPRTGELTGGSVEEETRRVMQNLEAVLKAAGLDFGSVVKTTVYLKDLADFSAMNEIYGEYFSESPPARSTVEVSALPKGARIEVDLIAFER